MNEIRVLTKVLWAITFLTFVSLGWYWSSIIPLVGWINGTVRAYRLRKKEESEL